MESKEWGECGIRRGGGEMDSVRVRETEERKRREGQ